MPNYAPEELHKFQNKAPDKPQDALHHWARPTYGHAMQHTNLEDISPLLPPKQISLVQKIVGTFMYYSLDIEPIMLVALGDLALAHSKATEKLTKMCRLPLH